MKLANNASRSHRTNARVRTRTFADPFGKLEIERIPLKLWEQVLSRLVSSAGRRSVHQTRSNFAHHHEVRRHFSLTTIAPQWGKDGMTICFLCVFPRVVTEWNATKRENLTAQACTHDQVIKSRFSLS